MNKRPHLITTMSCAWILFLLFADTSTATIPEILDQSFVLTRFSSNAAVGGFINQNISQTVHVGTTGQLSRLEFWGFQHGSDLSDFALDIRPVDGNLRPVEHDNLRYGRVVIAHQSLATLIGTSDISPYLYSVDLIPLNLHFNAGDHFAFNFSSTNPAAGFGIGIMGDVAPTPGPYASGQAYLRNTNQNNGLFFEWTDIFPPNPPGPNTVDLGFRTFMVVPEPSTFLLLVAVCIPFFGRPTRRAPA